MVEIINCLIILVLIPYIISDINIHVIPHTHLDPGWLNTPEEYYYNERIEDIFNTMLYTLLVDREKTFVINELFYFLKWYNSKDKKSQSNIKKLIKQKRVEFVSGGYVVNDEATPLYYNIMDQIRIGHQFLQEEFGVIPKTGWYIDSFGHSAANAHILSKLNYENLVLGRLHYDYLNLLKNEKNTEFYWAPFSNKPILTHILPLHYGFNLFQEDLGKIESEFETNLDQICTDLFNNLKESLRGLRHNNIMFLYGDDFQFKDSTIFSNIDKLIKLIKKKETQEKIKKILDTNEKINFFYSTPEKYFNSMKNDLEKNGNKLETFKNIDFYPLRTDCFWTGFFTSRPYLKGYIRKASNIFFTISKYHSLNRLTNQNLYQDNDNNNNSLSNLDSFRKVVGLTQHHDAITGTCRQYVSADYIRSLKYYIDLFEEDLQKDLEQFLNIKISNICYSNYLVDQDQERCSKQFLISKDTSKDKIKIGLLNPQFSSSSDENKILINIEIIESNSFYVIEGVKSQFFCLNENNLKNKELFKYQNKCFLSFFYKFKKGEEIAYVVLNKITKGKKYNKYYSLNSIINREKIELIKKKDNIQSLIFYPKQFEFNLEYNNNNKNNKINFSYYDGMYYVNADNCKDGAYQFSPYNKYPEKVKIDYKNSFYFQSDLGITFVTRNTYASFTFFTIFYEPFFIKVDHIFDSVEESYFLNRFSFGYSFVLKTNLNNMKEDKKPIFYTDSNGIETIQRKIDSFPYNESANVTVGANFYPVTSYICIKDENNNNGDENIVTVFNDRPQAGTGLLPGSIILVLQRMSYGADEKGLDENMYELESMKTYDFRTTHFIVFGPNSGGKKFDLINFIFEYFNSASLFFKIEKENNLHQKINEKNKPVIDIFNKNIKTSPDIRSSYQLVNNNLIIGEYFRYNNEIYNSNKVDENNFGNVSFDFPDDTKFNIFYDETGVNYNVKFNSNNINSYPKIISSKKQSFKVEKNAFLYIYFYFKD